MKICQSVYVFKNVCCSMEVKFSHLKKTLKSLYLLKEHKYMKGRDILVAVAVFISHQTGTHAKSLISLPVDRKIGY